MISIRSIGLLGLTWPYYVLAWPSLATNRSNHSHWETLASIPNPRQEHGVAAIGRSTIAAVGGTAVDGLYVSSTDLVQLYDIPSDTWKTVAPLPIKINHPNVASVGPKLYVLGGLVDGPASGDVSGSEGGTTINWQATGASFAYDPQTDSWSPLPSMPPGTARGSAVTVAYGPRIYLAGGMTVLSARAQDAVDSVLAFDTHTENWQRLPAAAAQLPESRQHAAGGLVGDMLLVAAGRRYGQTLVRDTLFTLDLTNLTAGWSTSATHFPTARGGVSGGAVGTKMYVFGGEGNPATYNGIFNETEAVDLVSGRAERLGVMPVPRHGTQAAVVGGKIYIPGGGLQQDGKAVGANGTIMFGQQTNYFDVYIP